MGIGQWQKKKEHIDAAHTNQDKLCSFRRWSQGTILLMHITQMYVYNCYATLND